MDINLNKNLGDLIRYKRKDCGYSTQELAKLLDVSPGLINNIENAKTDTFNIDLLYKLSSILDIPITDILSYKINNIFFHRFSPYFYLAYTKNFIFLTLTD